MPHTSILVHSAISWPRNILGKQRIVFFQNCRGGHLARRRRGTKSAQDVHRLYMCAGSMPPRMLMTKGFVHTLSLVKPYDVVSVLLRSFLVLPGGPKHLAKRAAQESVNTDELTTYGPAETGSDQLQSLMKRERERLAASHPSTLQQVGALGCRNNSNSRGGLEVACPCSARASRRSYGDVACRYGLASCRTSGLK